MDYHHQNFVKYYILRKNIHTKSIKIIIFLYLFFNIYNDLFFNQFPTVGHNSSCARELIHAPT